MSYSRKEKRREEKRRGGETKRGGEGKAVCHEGRVDRKISERTIHGP
jgi:hypothetical protein